MIDRTRYVLSTATEFIRKNVKSIPVDIFSLCVDCGVSLVPLSQMIRDGFDANVVFGLWGNPDGTSSLWKGKAVIAYNDSMPNNRVRFTLAEELMHILLGHLGDSRFNMFSQEFDEKTYAQYEHEAKMAAGMLLCPPKFFYTFEDELNPYWLSEFCSISESCAERTILDYRENRDRIKGLPSFHASINPKYNHKRMWWYRSSRHGELYEVL